MEDPFAEALRTFKTAWFAKAARKAHLTDEELCSAIQQLLLGQADDLRRCIQETPREKSVPLHHSCKSRTLLGLGYLFAKQNRANIEDDELAGFRGLVKAYAGLTNSAIEPTASESKLDGDLQ